MSRPAIDFVRYVLGLRSARTSVTASEARLLTALAADQSLVIEVGVFEGVTSLALAEALGPGGRVLLVDPFWQGTRLERLLRFSYSEFVARRTVHTARDRVLFLRCPSQAAAQLPEVQDLRADLIFIDADHSYDEVLADFRVWSRRLAVGGTLAFHDSRPCGSRPELDDSVGPVRLVKEIASGHHGDWALVGGADSLTALRRAQGG